MEVNGKVVKKLAVESGISKSEKVWKKQTIVIDTGAEYNPEIAVTAFGDEKLTQMNKLDVGMEVKILCNISSKEYNGRYFHNIDGYHFSNVSNKPKGLDVHFEGTTPEDLPF
jgi:hypothetical protein